MALSIDQNFQTADIMLITQVHCTIAHASCLDSFHNLRSVAVNTGLVFTCSNISAPARILYV